MTMTPRWRSAIPLVAAAASFVVVSVVAWSWAQTFLAPEPPSPPPKIASAAPPVNAPPVARLEDDFVDGMKSTISDIESKLAQCRENAARFEALSDARGKDFDRLSAENKRLADDLAQAKKALADEKTTAERDLAAARLRQAAAERSADEFRVRSEQDAAGKRRQLEADLVSVEASLTRATAHRDALQSSYDSLRRQCDAELARVKDLYDKDLARAESERRQAHRFGYPPPAAEGFYARSKSAADRSDASRRSEIDGRYQPLLAAAKGPLDLAVKSVAEIQARRQKILSALGRTETR